MNREMYKRACHELRARDYLMARKSLPGFYRAVAYLIPEVRRANVTVIVTRLKPRYASGYNAFVTHVNNIFFNRAVYIMGHCSDAEIDDAVGTLQRFEDIHYRALHAVADAQIALARDAHEYNSDVLADN